MRDLLPVTGVGSLPHRDPDAAVRFVLETTGVPYLPQLPARHPEERMLVQWGDGLCGCGAVPGEVGLRRGAPAGPRHEAFGGAAAMLAALPGDTPRVKTQATGPVTLTIGLLAAGHPGEGLYDCVVEGLVRRIEDHVIAVEQRLPDAEIVLVLDEPALVGLTVPDFPVRPADAHRLLREVLDRAPVPAGIHCCGDTDWTLVASLRPAWLSWDVSSVGPRLPFHADELAAAVADGTRMIWGLVPVVAGTLPGDLPSRFHRLLGTLVLAGADLARLTTGSLYSPACGLAGLGEDHAEIVARRVIELTEELLPDLADEER